MTGIKELEKFGGEYGIKITAKMLDLFSVYGDMLLEWNKRINLTAITDPGEVVVKHFLDSIIPLAYIKGERPTLIDIGSGAGFPGIPMKIAMPELSVTLLDSSGKRTAFLEAVTKRLGIEVVCVKARAEEFALSPYERERYDYAVARAVSALPALCEYCLPFVKVEGNFLALKGPGIEGELETGKKAIGLLGGEHEKTVGLTLPGQIKRSLVIIKKISQTPSGYPRKSAKIAKMPL